MYLKQKNRYPQRDSGLLFAAFYIGGRLLEDFRKNLCDF